MAHYPQVPLYLIYGNQADAMLKMRDALLEMRLPADMRNENLTEYYPSGNTDKISLASQWDEIAGDLATMSFIPGACKCVIVTNPAEIYGTAGKPPKAAAGKATKNEAALLNWLVKDLPHMEHFLILLAFEDESAQKEVNERSPLYQAVQKVGFLRKFSDTKAIFRIEDAILERKMTNLMDAIRDLWKPGKGDSSVYNACVKTVRFLMESNIARERKIGQDPAQQALLFPAEAQRNLFKAHERTREKYLRMQNYYRTADLLKAYEGLLEVYRALRPRPGDVYVADAQVLLERTMIRLLTSNTGQR